MSKKPKFYPCNVCGEPAVACLRPDPDVKGLCFCDEHRAEVYDVYSVITSADSSLTELKGMLKQMMKGWKHK